MWRYLAYLAPLSACMGLAKRSFRRSWENRLNVRASLGLFDSYNADSVALYLSQFWRTSSIGNRPASAPHSVVMFEIVNRWSTDRVLIVASDPVNSMA